MTYNELMKKVKELEKEVDRMHPVEILDDYQDGYDEAVAIIHDMVRDLIREVETNA